MLSTEGHSKAGKKDREGRGGGKLKQVVREDPPEEGDM